MAKQIFREQALGRLATPGQLDQLMAVTSPAGWIALVGALLLLLTAILWGVFGTLQSELEASGVLTRPGGVATVSACSSGRVAEVLVPVGAAVSYGQPLLRLAPAESAAGLDALPVVSPLSGRVIDIAVRRGDQVTEGEPLATVESVDRPLRGVVFVAAGDGQQVQPGGDVRLFLGSSGSRAARSWSGHVESVGRLPVTRSAMLRVLQREEWLERYARLGPLLEVVVVLDDEQAAAQLASGTPCQARIVVETKAPLELILGSLAR
jgi:multidrug resistance efflux pump